MLSRRGVVNKEVSTKRLTGWQKSDFIYIRAMKSALNCLMYMHGDDDFYLFNSCRGRSRIDTYPT
jgi:hypothetical protein